jgi:hypothetical protein
MKVIAKVLIGILAFATSNSYAGPACSYTTEPIVKFIPQEYVFLGEVAGFVGPIRSNKILRDAWGLKVRVTHEFNLPNKSGDYLEVYPLGLTSACQKTGTSQGALEEYYPTRSKVRVVGMEASRFDSRSEDGTIRLEATEMNGGLVARNDLRDGFDTTAETVYDYRKDKTHTRSAQDKGSVVYYYDRLGDFELRKDLIRLRDAKKVSERYAILKRLSDYSHYDIDYSQLVKNHIQNKRLVNQLLKLQSR